MRRLPLALFAIILALFITVGLLFPTFYHDSPTLAAHGTVRVTQVDTSAYPQISLYTSVDSLVPSDQLSLTPADFQIVEDGTAVSLTDFAAPGASTIRTVLVIDHSGSMQDANKMDGARAAAQAFVGMVRPNDQVALIGFNNQVEVVEPFTNDQVALQESLARLRADGGTALYDGVVAGVDLLQDQPGRRALLVLTDGQDCRDMSTCPADQGSTSSLDAAIAHARAAGQSVYLIGLGDRSSASDSDQGVDEQVLRQIATETDGRYFYSPHAGDLADLYTGLAGSLQGEYRLTYVSPRPFYDGTRRDIQVVVAGQRVNAGYTEAHLINVASHPLIGVVLLLPLLGLLGLPSLLAMRLRRRDRVPEQMATNAPRPGDTESLVADPAACLNCAAPLRPGAKFCGRCGTVLSSPAVRRTFCDMCGRPLPLGATTCTECGEPVARRDG